MELSIGQFVLDNAAVSVIKRVAVIVRLDHNLKRVQHLKVYGFAATVTRNQPIIAYRYVLFAVELAKWVIVAVPCPWELA